MDRSFEERLGVACDVRHRFCRRCCEAFRQGIDKHYFVTFFVTVAVFVLTGIAVQFLFQITFTVTMHFGLIAVFAKHLCNKGLLRPELQHNEAFAESLQQEAQRNAYDEEIFHGTNL